MKITTSDIFLIDSDRFGPKMVKFFMTAPTWAHHIYRMIRGTQETVQYYHAGCFLDDKTVIEQQAKVRLKDAEDILNSPNNKCIIHYKLATLEQLANFLLIVHEDIGKGYDVLNVIGKFATWLTGIKWFAQHVQSKDKEICLNRVASWYKRAFGEDFGVKHHSELTTHSFYKYVLDHPEKFDIVY